MVDKYIEQAPGGEMQNPDGGEYWPLSKNNSEDYWMYLGNLLLQPRYTISPSVSSNNLSLSLQHIAGANPSGSKPLKFRLGSSEFSLASNLSFTKNAGTNWCNLGSAELAAQDVDLFVYLIGETGAAAGLKLSCSRVPYAETMGDFVNTTTNEKYILGGWTNFNAADNVLNIGRFRARLSAGAGFNWSIPNAKVINRPIFETDWLIYAPQVTPGSGTITTLGAVSGAYKVRGNSYDMEQNITITTNGTAGNGINGTVPFAATTTKVAKGREGGVTGNMLQGVLLNTCSWLTYNNAHPGGNGHNLVGSAESVRLA